MIVGMIALMLVAAGIENAIVVQPVVVADEGNGKVTLRFDLPVGESRQPALPVDGQGNLPDGSFDDFSQQAVINTSTGALEITGTNPNGNGSLRRTGNTTVGRISWISGNPYCWRIPVTGGAVEYYNLNMTGYGSCDDVDVVALLTAKGGNASAQISINSSSGTTPYLDETWRFWSITKPSSSINWNTSNNVAKVNIWNGSDTMGVNRIAVYVNGAVRIQPAPGPFSLTSPTDGATNQPTSGTLRWGTSSNAERYKVYFGTAYPPPYLRTVTAPTTSTTYSGDNGQTYYWRVIAENSSGSRQCNAVFSFSTVIAAPGAFDLTSPANGSRELPATGTLRWASSSGATSYDVYLGLTNPPGFLRNVTGTSTPYSCLPGRTYYWYVVARNSAGQRECNSRFYFVTAPLGPGPFELLTPVNNAVGVATRGTMTWQAAAGATSYYINLDTQNPPQVTVGSSTGTSFNYGSVVPLRNNTTYFWSVLAINGEGTRRSTSVFRFGTETVAVDESGAPGTSRAAVGLVDVRPSHFSRSIRLTCSVPANAVFSLRVLDAAGVAVRELSKGTAVGGVHQVLWDGRDERGHVVPKGIYLFSLESGGQSWVKKAVKTR